MKAFFKQLKWQALIGALVFIILGIMLICFPDTMFKTFCYIAASLMILAGIFEVTAYFARDVSKSLVRNDLVIGLAAIFIGVFMIIKVDFLLNLLPIILGIAVIVSGFMKLQDFIDALRMGAQNTTRIVMLALSLINIAFGVILVVNPFGSMSVLLTVLGVGLLFSGITDAVATIMLSKRASDYEKDMDVLNNGGYSSYSGYTDYTGSTDKKDS